MIFDIVKSVFGPEEQPKSAIFKHDLGNSPIILNIFLMASSKTGFATSITFLCQITKHESSIDYLVSTTITPQFQTSFIGRNTRNLAIKENSYVPEGWSCWHNCILHFLHSYAKVFFSLPLFCLAPCCLIYKYNQSLGSK